MVLKNVLLQEKGLDNTKTFQKPGYVMVQWDNWHFWRTIFLFQVSSCSNPTIDYASSGSNLSSDSARHGRSGQALLRRRSSTPDRAAISRYRRGYRLCNAPGVRAAYPASEQGLFVFALANSLINRVYPRLFLKRRFCWTAHASEGFYWVHVCKSFNRFPQWREKGRAEGQLPTLFGGWVGRLGGG